MINSKEQLLTSMQNGAVIITPNNRLSNELLEAFLGLYPQQVQAKPHCLPYTAFLQNSFKKLCQGQPQKKHPLLLSAHQSRYLLRQVISQSTKKSINEGLLLAVEEAWRRCHLWQIDFNLPIFSHTAQTRQFQLWAQDWLKELKKIAAITEDQLASYLVEQNFNYVYQTLVWACFDDYNPQQLSLQNYFSKQACSIEHYDLSNSTNSTSYCYAAKDKHDEYQQLIAWIEDHLDSGEKTIAIVVPELQNQAQELKRFLQQHLSIEFNISLGQPLADYSLVAHALCWLGLDREELSVDEARLLLYSPFIGHAQTEMLERAQFSEENRILQELHFSQAAFLQELKRTVPKLAELLGELAQYPEIDSPQGWIAHFTKRLIRLGFPGDYVLNSSTYQCYQRFLSLFDEFRQLALVCAEMTKSEAYLTLKNLAKATIFQAKKEKARIQILGLLEAAGCSFDSLWVTSLTDQCLPRKPKLSAFIPISLQRDNQMPHACPTRELELAEKTINRLVNSSSSVVFSYPRLSDDKPNMPSPLISVFSAFLAYPIKQTLTGEKLVAFAETYQQPFLTLEKISGGTAILSNQAKCPFRAFAAHRLHAKATLKTSEGPDAKERGQLVHKVMELLWQNLQNQRTLLELDPKQLDKLIEQVILQALEPLTQQRSYSFPTLIQEVELTKLKRLVTACLEWERKRPAFSVAALEQAFTINLAGIEFQLRVDRLDQLEEGQKWVIDYKSSLPQRLPWKEDRPKEPQLLLYALLDETINGLLFAQLKAGQIDCKGLTESPYPGLGLSAIKKDEAWNDYRQYWQAQLNELATEFSQGNCPPQPASLSVCQNCDFQNLCRFEPASPIEQ